jgi:hypothetical protein
MHFSGWLLLQVLRNSCVCLGAPKTAKTEAISNSKTPFRLPKVDRLANQPLQSFVAYFLGAADVFYRLIGDFGPSKFEILCSLTKKIKIVVNEHSNAILTSISRTNQQPTFINVYLLLFWRA